VRISKIVSGRRGDPLYADLKADGRQASSYSWRFEQSLRDRLRRPTTFRNRRRSWPKELELLTGKTITPLTIYVALEDEGVAVWRPVAAAWVAGDLYRILSANSDHPEETWEFDRGDLVRCADRTLSSACVKVAVARVSREAS
jgi:hypothetical protein